MHQKLRNIALAGSTVQRHLQFSFSHQNSSYGKERASVVMVPLARYEFCFARRHPLPALVSLGGAGDRWSPRVAEPGGSPLLWCRGEHPKWAETPDSFGYCQFLNIVGSTGKILLPERPVGSAELPVLPGDPTCSRTAAGTVLA